LYFMGVDAGGCWVRKEGNTGPRSSALCGWLVALHLWLRDAAPAGAGACIVRCCQSCLLRVGTKAVQGATQDWGPEGIGDICRACAMPEGGTKGLTVAHSGHPSASTRKGRAPEMMCTWVFLVPLVQQPPLLRLRNASHPASASKAAKHTGSVCSNTR
jgi:hypothetical protein